jgi:hypothetical protein
MYIFYSHCFTFNAAKRSAIDIDLLFVNGSFFVIEGALRSRNSVFTRCSAALATCDS